MLTLFNIIIRLFLFFYHSALCVRVNEPGVGALCTQASREDTHVMHEGVCREKNEENVQVIHIYARQDQSSVLGRGSELGLRYKITRYKIT